MFAPLTLIASFGAFAVYANAIGAYLLIGGAFVLGIIPEFMLDS